MHLTPTELGGTIILVHGLVRSKHSMSPLAYFLRKRGYTVLNFGYRSHGGKIEEHSEELRRFLEKNLLDASTPLFFITHSLGSLVARKLELQHLNRFQMRRIVMRGPSNQGALIARFLTRLPLMDRFFGPCLKQIAELNIEEPSLPLEVGIIAGGTGRKLGITPILPDDNDMIVRVEETKLAHMTDFRRVFVPHAVMMFSPKITQLALNFLHTGRFSPRSTEFEK